MPSYRIVSYRIVSHHIVLCRRTNRSIEALARFASRPCRIMKCDRTELFFYVDNVICLVSDRLVSDHAGSDRMRW